MAQHEGSLGCNMRACIVFVPAGTLAAAHQGVHGMGTGLTTFRHCERFEASTLAVWHFILAQLRHQSALQA